ncbi:MAG: hypothetical protein M1837_000523 [Sclerophora amabilis]|nr:MAG: hypothetical protein M1837_000523 [Sclerophora amabilis]
MEHSGQFNILPSTRSIRSATPQASSIVKDRRALRNTSGNLQSHGLDNLYPDLVKSEASSPASSGASPPSYLSHGSYEECRKRWAKAERDLESLEDDVAQYRHYRAKQRRDNGREGEGVWHDRVERAFQRGLSKYPPLGRTKVPWRNGKSYGRNELIAAYIVRKTGEWRSRKQVSSHIQVLKAKMKEDQAWMALVTPTSDQNPELLKRLAAGVSTTNTNSKTIRPQAACSVQNVVRPINFDMWVEPPRAPHEESSIERNVHVYTALATSTPLPAVKLDSVGNWRATFPLLASLHHNGAADCEITLLETSINMNTSASLTGCELGTRFEVFASSAFADHTWHSITNVYSPGNLVQNRYDPVPFADKGFNGAVKLRPRFASSFWAHKFVELGVKQNVWEDRSDERLAEAKARSYVRGISAMQELYATPNSDSAEKRPKRVALFLWKFTKTQPGETSGKTQWRKLIPPPSKILSNSAAPTPAPAPASAPAPAPAIPVDWSILEDDGGVSSSVTQSVAAFYDGQFHQPQQPLDVTSALEQLSDERPDTTPTQAYYPPYPAGNSQESINPFTGDDFVANLYTQDTSATLVDDYHDAGGVAAAAAVAVNMSLSDHTQGFYDDHWHDYGVGAGTDGHGGELHTPHSSAHQLEPQQSFLGEQDERFVMVGRDLHHSFQ